MFNKIKKLAICGIIASVLLLNIGSIAYAADPIVGVTGEASATIENLAMVTVKYALPTAAIVAVLYGGKKLYDYIRSEESTIAEDLINLNQTSRIR